MTDAKAKKLLDAVRAGWWTFVFAFVGLFGLSLVGWLGDLYDWASTSGQGEFPGVGTLGYAAAAAAASAAIGLVNTLVRLAQAYGLPGQGPSY